MIMDNKGSPLRRAMEKARMQDVDLAEALGVDVKTVQRWMRGTATPHAKHRWGVAGLLEVGDLELWPTSEDRGPSGELQAVYAHRSVVPRELWLGLFRESQLAIDVLVYAGLFLAEDVELTRAIGDRARAGVRVRIALGDPDSEAVAERGREEGIFDAMSAKVRNAVVLLEPLTELDGVELRLHGTRLYNSLFRGDDDLLVNQHVHGTAAAQAPVLHLRRAAEGESHILGTYLASFERVWAQAVPMSGEVTPLR